MRKWLVALLVVVVVLVGADIGGRAYAQRQAERAIAQHLSARADPAVRIHGFSFLLQALTGRYSHVSIGSSHVALGAMADVAAQVDLLGIDYPLRDAIDGTTTDMTIGRAQLRLIVPAAVLASLLGVPDLTLSAAGGSAMTLRTTVSVAGEPVPVTADVAVGVTGRTLRVAAAPVAAAGTALPSALVAELRRRLTTEVAIPQLPFGVTSATAAATDGNLVISASATDLAASQLAFPN